MIQSIRINIDKSLDAVRDPLRGAGRSFRVRRSAQSLSTYLEFDEFNRIRLSDHDSLPHHIGTDLELRADREHWTTLSLTILSHCGVYAPIALLAAAKRRAAYERRVGERREAAAAAERRVNGCDLPEHAVVVKKHAEMTAAARLSDASYDEARKAWESARDAWRAAFAARVGANV